MNHLSLTIPKNLALILVSCLILLSCTAADTSSESNSAEIVATPSPTNSEEGGSVVENTETVENNTNSTSKTAEAKPKVKDDGNADSEVEKNSKVTQPADPVVGAYLTLENYQKSKESYVNSKVVLFFNAAWCSTCKKARDNFQASLNQIPADLTIVVVDFDNSTELRRAYGVTVQHTFVQIDQNQNLVKKWSGSITINELVNQTL